MTTTSTCVLRPMHVRRALLLCASAVAVAGSVGLLPGASAAARPPGLPGVVAHDDSCPPPLFDQALGGQDPCAGRSTAARRAQRLLPR